MPNIQSAVSIWCLLVSIHGLESSGCGQGLRWVSVWVSSIDQTNSHELGEFLGIADIAP
jgi:hypothetical protein